MKSNMTFLAPLLSGIVIGLAMMIAAILSTLSSALKNAEVSEISATVVNITDIFNVQTMIPPYYLQIAIGIYLIEVIFILTGTLVTIDSGEDKLERTRRLSENLKKGMVFYFLTALLASLALFILTSVVLGSNGGLLG
jgi:hypothetical protein